MWVSACLGFLLPAQVNFSDHRREKLKRHVMSLQVLEQAMPRNTTQMVLLGGIVGSLVMALYCLWAKTGRPVPWSPARRRSISRYRAGRHNV